MQIRKKFKPVVFKISCFDHSGQIDGNGYRWAFPITGNRPSSADVTALNHDRTRIKRTSRTFKSNN